MSGAFVVEKRDKKDMRIKSKRLFILSGAQKMCVLRAQTNWYKDNVT